ncbi:carboxymuconolactone decarboxylase family protein [Pseudooceanicola sp.]|uniref:carboxymuconolactone decarboxylase family protein n=1 Tax=Pseudooceanicola sp. TaxID=1914328 RepID=UPI002619698F|nr:carboxymuconolactone decarboxylase family protein [Pseudooceanicola sp.]MDF1854703.1 carboxymuconolactone decarboxylase family protein [Pseudooceanicola sp.]
MSWRDKLEQTKSQLRVLNKTIPDATRAFGGLTKAVKTGSALDFKTKEFVALGIAVTKGCESCIVLHVDTLIRSGASRDEVGDALAMTLQMGGGPAMMYAAKALECFDELAAA